MISVQLAKLLVSEEYVAAHDSGHDDRAFVWSRATGELVKVRDMGIGKNRGLPIQGFGVTRVGGGAAPPPPRGVC